jgi:hypothetical protein
MVGSSTNVGDEILALFGVAVAQDDDPVQAIRAILALHETARGLSGQSKSASVSRCVFTVESIADWSWCARETGAMALTW